MEYTEFIKDFLKINIYIYMNPGSHTKASPYYCISSEIVRVVGAGFSQAKHEPCL